MLTNFRGTKTLKFNEPIKTGQVKANCCVIKFAAELLLRTK